MADHAERSDPYQQAGVNIDTGNRLVTRIKPLAKRTNRPGVMSSLGGFGALFDLKSSGYQDPILVSGSDGVGTKLKLAQELNIYHSIGIDLVAMCANDILAQGAEPLFFLDYFATSRLNLHQAESIISGIAEGCQRAGCALIGGETAEMPGLYQNNDFDLAGFCVGAVERDQILPHSDIEADDILMGLPASGFHSNGYSLIRKIIADQSLDITSPAPFAADKKLGEILLTPTRIYVSSILNLIKQQHIKAVAHITGGGLLENIPRILPEFYHAQIDCKNWDVPAVQQFFSRKGQLRAGDLARIFNCGIGLCLVVSPDQFSTVEAYFQDSQQDFVSLGKIIHDKRYQDSRLILQNQDDAWKSFVQPS